MRQQGKTKRDSLRQELSRLLDSGKFHPHERFFSVEKLKQLYGVSQATVTTVLQELEAGGRLYRKPSSGTYVSPPLKIRQILLVSRMDRLYSHSVNCFVRGVEENIPESLNCRIMFVMQEEFQQNFPDFDLYYRNVAAVVFIWTPDLYARCAGILQDKKILTLFYGSSRHCDLLTNGNCFFYNDREIVHTALDRLYAAGHRKIGCVYGEGKTLEFRYQCYLEWMNEHDLPVMPEWTLYENMPGDCNRILLRQPRVRCTAFLITTATLFVEILTTFQQKKISVPEEISLLSIELPYVYRYLFPKPLSLYIDHQGNGKKIIEMVDGALSSGSLKIPDCYSDIFWYEGETVLNLDESTSIITPNS